MFVSPGREVWFPRLQYLNQENFVKDKMVVGLRGCREPFPWICSELHEESLRLMFEYKTVEGKGILLEDS